MQTSLFENTQPIEVHQPALRQADVSSRLSLTSLVEDKEGVLYILLWLLETYGYVYYDTEDDADIIEVEDFLKSKNTFYAKGQRNRMFLHYQRSNGC